MIAPHPFDDSGERLANARGRMMRLCAACRGPANHPAHRQADRQAATARHVDRVQAGATIARITSAVDRRISDRLRPADIEPERRELALLRIAVDLAWPLPEDAVGGWRIHARISELHALLHGDTLRDAVADPQPIRREERPPAPPVLPRRAHRNRWLRNVRSDEIRDVIAAAVDAGWQCELRGSGHVLCQGPAGSFTASATAAGDHRAALNVRAQARRAGLDV